MCNCTPQNPPLVTSIVTKGLELIDSIQRIRFARAVANSPTEHQETIAQERLGICSLCENKKDADLVNAANELVLSKEVSEKHSPHLQKQCGLCGCSCILLAYDQLVTSNPCKAGKF